MLVFAETIALNKGHGLQPALGYSGLKESDNKAIPFYQKLLDQKKFFDVEGTEWVWHHSDMLIGSDKILENLYKEKVVKADNFQFGKYKK